MRLRNKFTTTLTLHFLLRRLNYTIQYANYNNLNFTKGSTSD